MEMPWLTPERQKRRRHEREPFSAPPVITELSFVSDDDEDTEERHSPAQPSFARLRDARRKRRRQTSWSSSLPPLALESLSALHAASAHSPRSATTTLNTSSTSSLGSAGLFDTSAIQLNTSMLGRSPPSVVPPSVPKKRSKYSNEACALWAVDAAWAKLRLDDFETHEESDERDNDLLALRQLGTGKDFVAHVVCLKDETCAPWTLKPRSGRTLRSSASVGTELSRHAVQRRQKSYDELLTLEDMARKAGTQQPVSPIQRQAYVRNMCRRSRGDTRVRFVLKIGRHACSEMEAKKAYKQCKAVWEMGTHPHIVKIYCMWQENGRLHMLTELCEHGTLAQFVEARFFKNSRWSLRWLERRRLQEDTVWRFIRDAASALSRLHDRGLLHGDVKTHNILVASQGIDNYILKFADFGQCVRLSEVQLAPCRFDEGDVRFLAPEVLQHRVSTKVDIFALGMTIYALIHNTQLPVRGEGWHALRTSTMRLPQQAPALQGGRGSEDLQQLLCRMIAACPEDRPSALELLQHPRILALKKKPRRGRSSSTPTPRK
ncbi:MAG: hypothetical protein MHM6MM_004736 [Cercozoa sp. M6MM]